MEKTYERTLELLNLWGASEKQIREILPADAPELQTRINLLISINDCLQLLFRDEIERNRYMRASNKGPFFEGRKPLEIIASGEMTDLTDVHTRIRNMICI